MYERALSGYRSVRSANRTTKTSAGFAIALLTQLRAQEHLLGNELILSAVDLVLKNAPVTPVPELYVAILEMGVQSAWRGPAFRRSMATHMVAAAARLDPLHLLDVNPGQMLRLHSLLAPNRYLLLQILPEAADLEFLLDRVDLEELDRRQPDAAALALTLAVRSQSDDWISSRTPHSAEHFSVRLLGGLTPHVMLYLAQVWQSGMPEDDLVGLVKRWSKGWYENDDGLLGLTLPGVLTSLAAAASQETEVADWLWEASGLPPEPA